MSIKIERIASAITKELSYIFANEVKDEHIKNIVITDCKVTNDLSFAKVYFRLLDDSKKTETLKSLEHASGYIRKELAERIDIRHIPELTFVYDDSIDYGIKIENILEEIHKEEREDEDEER